MQSLFVMVMLGVFGGLAVALLIPVLQWRSALVVPRRLAQPTPAIINMAHIPVEGVGGLGLVAAVVVVAMWDPRIRVAMSGAAVLGAGLAFGQIAFRRRASTPPCGGDGPGDGSILRLQDRPRPPVPPRYRSRDSLKRSCASRWGTAGRSRLSQALLIERCELTAEPDPARSPIDSAGITHLARLGDLGARAASAAQAA